MEKIPTEHLSAGQADKPSFPITEDGEGDSATLLLLAGFGVENRIAPVTCDRAVGGSPGGCSGPPCVFSADLDSPGQGGPARSVPATPHARPRIFLAICPTRELPVGVYAGRGMVRALEKEKLN
jgi:hypothetical protein